MKRNNTKTNNNQETAKPEQLAGARAELQTLLQDENNVALLVKLLQSSPAATAAAKKAPAPAPTPEAPPATLRDQIREALLERSMDDAQLVNQLKIRNRDKFNKEMEALRAEGQIFNLVSERRPIWTWKIGEEAEPKMLRRMIQQLITERPMFLDDLVAATGSTVKKVSGQVQELSRSGAKIQDLGGGHGHRRQYFILGPGAVEIAVAPKQTPKGTVIQHGARAAKKA